MNTAQYYSSKCLLSVIVSIKGDVGKPGDPGEPGPKGEKVS